MSHKRGKIIIFGKGPDYRPLLNGKTNVYKLTTKRRHNFFFSSHFSIYLDRQLIHSLLLDVHTKDGLCVDSLVHVVDYDHEDRLLRGLRR